MVKSLFTVFVVLFFSGCGVDTSSSGEKNLSSENDSNVTDNYNDLITDDALYIVDPNPTNGIGDGIIYIEPNPLDDCNCDTDDNQTDNNQTDNNQTDNNQEPVDVDSIFDTSDAIEDPFACTIGDYNEGFTNNVIKDNSNDYLGEVDLEDGVGISSRYPNNADSSKTEVALFYYDLKPSRSMDVKSYFQNDYTVSIDTAWADNDETVIYVRLPMDKNGLYSCYRYDAKTIDVDGQVTVTKVYRVNN